MPITTGGWTTRVKRVADLHLDARNPRLGRDGQSRSPRDILQFLFDHDNVLEIAESIALGGYFANEPLLAVRENGDLIIVEGNRRLAALKALRDPSLIVGPAHSRLSRLAGRISDPLVLQKVPVTLAPNRRATDRQLAARHVDRSVLGWTTENKARFILDKLEVGYTEPELQSELGFSLADVREARRLVAIADMMRTVDLPEKDAAKVNNPRATILTNLDRVISSAAGRSFLHVEPDDTVGLRGRTSAAEFRKGFTRLVRDVASGDQTSRSLNTDEDIREYFKTWPSSDLPRKKRATFLPYDIIGVDPGLNRPKSAPVVRKAKRSRKESTTVLPKSLAVRFGSDRLARIRKELTQLSRDRFPNAGAVLLRVFLEIAILDYLERRGALAPLLKRLAGTGSVQKNGPQMRALVTEILKLTEPLLKVADYRSVQRALSYDDRARFSIGELNAFVHGKSDLPTGEDLLQFWHRIEPLMRLMLEEQAVPGQQ